MTELQTRTKYTYDPANNLSTKTDARSITTTYSYDALNRITGSTYSNNDPSISFGYDASGCLGLAQCQNIGHRTSMTDAAGSEIWAFDLPDRIQRDQRTTTSSPSNITKTSTYYLDYAGNTTQAIYPTGREVNYTFDAANRPSSAIDGASGMIYATGWQTGLPAGCSAAAACYTPQGTFYGLSFGQNSSFTGLNLTHIYNSRLQPLEFKASSTGGNAIDITYSFVDPITGKNAGNVNSITNNLNSSRTQNFTYDQLNRILSAGTSTTTGTYCWGYLYSFDAWGNLLSQAGWSPTYNACTEPILASVTADGNNHISPLSYDAAGNTLYDGVFAYTWNGESQLKTANGVAYAYDGDGRRVSKSNGKLYWYDGGGEILAETDASGNTTAEYVFFGGKRIAMLSRGVPNGGFEQGLAGWSVNSGTVQLVTNASQAHSGSNYVQLSSPANGIAGIVSGTLAVNPGDRVTFGGWASLQSGAAGSLGWWLAVYDANHTAFAFVGSSPVPSSSTWTYESGTYTVPSNGAYVQLYAQIYQPTSNTVLWVDDGFLTAGANYYVEDMLGSSRVITTGAGVVCYDADFTPFGGERIITNSCTQNNYKFTGKERDSESGLDNFGARYHASNLGRFMTPDWAAKPTTVPYATFGDPQTLNLYSYVRNNPLSRNDPDGHEWAFVGNDKVKKEQLQKAFEAAVKSQGNGAWKAYEAIGKAKGVVSVGLGDLKSDTKFGDTKFSFTSQGGKLATVSGSITFNTNEKAMNVGNSTDLSTAASHEFTHVEAGLASPGGHLSGGLNNLAPYSAFGQEAAAYRNQDATAAAIGSAPGSQPLTPDTALSRSVAGTTGKTDAEMREVLKSYGYQFDPEKP